MLDTGRSENGGGTARFPTSVIDGDSQIRTRKSPVKSKVRDRHDNFTEHGFPSTYTRKNNNAIKNTAMFDPDRNMENENLVNKTNHL